MQVLAGMRLQSETAGTLIPWALNGFCIAAECRPAGWIGGDFYVISARERARLAFIVGDACGRGSEGAALLPELLPRARELIRSEARPSRILTELNWNAARILPIDRFVTAAALELDADLCTLRIANAGHVPAIVRSARSHVKVLGRASGPPLGVAANAAYREECFPLGLGDTVVVMTDGVLEGVETDLLSMSRLLELIAAAPAGARGVSDYILARLDRRRDSRRDDVTLLCVEAKVATAGQAAHLRRAS